MRSSAANIFWVSQCLSGSTAVVSMWSLLLKIFSAMHWTHPLDWGSENRLALQIHPSFRPDLTFLISAEVGCCAVSGNQQKQLGNWDMDRQDLLDWLHDWQAALRGCWVSAQLAPHLRQTPLSVPQPAPGDELRTVFDQEFVSRLQKCCVSWFVVRRHKRVDKSSQPDAFSSSWQVKRLLAALFPPLLTPLDQCVPCWVQVHWLCISNIPGKLR